MAEAIRTAIEMPAAERHRRMSASARRRRQQQHLPLGGQNYVRLAQIRFPGNFGGGRAKLMTQPLFDNLGPIARRVALASHLLVGLDYDGTLTPIVSDPSKAVLDSEVRNLVQLVAAPGNVGRYRQRPATPRRSEFG